jgi:hypothetical protein
VKRQSFRRLSAAVFSNRPDKLAAITDLLRALEVRVLAGNSEPPAKSSSRLHVFDGWDSIDQEPASLSHPPPLRILLLPFPRQDDLARAAAINFAAVLPLPLAVSDLATTIARILPPASKSRVH